MKSKMCATLYLHYIMVYNRWNGCASVEIFYKMLTYNTDSERKINTPSPNTRYHTLYALSYPPAPTSG